MLFFFTYKYLPEPYYYIKDPKGTDDYCVLYRRKKDLHAKYLAATTEAERREAEELLRKCQKDFEALEYFVKRNILYEISRILDHDSRNVDPTGLDFYRVYDVLPDDVRLPTSIYDALTTPYVVNIDHNLGDSLGRVFSSLMRGWKLDVVTPSDQEMVFGYEVTLNPAKKRLKVIVPNIE